LGRGEEKTLQNSDPVKAVFRFFAVILSLKQQLMSKKQEI
jgi:hypothetical protein